MIKIKANKNQLKRIFSKEISNLFIVLYDFNNEMNECFVDEEIVDKIE